MVQALRSCEAWRLTGSVAVIRGSNKIGQPGNPEALLAVSAVVTASFLRRLGR
jgi:hypothetical protein